MFVSFLPAISRDALNKIGRQLRSLRLHHCTGLSFHELARWINPIVRGWMLYYGQFYWLATYPLLMRINAYLMRWSARNTVGSKDDGRSTVDGSGSPKSTDGCSLTGNGQPWSRTLGDQGDKSRMNREIHVRIVGAGG